MIYFSFLIKFILCFFYNELKVLKRKVEYIKFLFNNVIFLKYIYYLFGKNVNPIKSLKFAEYTIEIKKKWNEYNKKNNFINSKKKILIENFINHPSYFLKNILIGKYLGSYFNNECIALTRQGDIRSEIILKSFGINRIYFYKNANFFERIKYLIKSLVILNKIQNTKDLVKVVVEKIDIGLTTYDTFIRYTRNPSQKRLDYRMIVIFSEALYANDFFNRFYRKHKISKLVQAEKQFVPLSIMFQKALSKNISIYNRRGTDHPSVRIYNTLKSGYESSQNFSKKLFFEIYNKHNKKALSIINPFIKSQIRNNFYGQPWGHFMQKKNNKLWKTHIDKVNKTNQITKKDFCKFLNWDPKKKIVTVFLHNLIDGNYVYGKRILFFDTCSWVQHLLKLIPSLTKVNWIIKTHPDDKIYQPKINFEKIVKDMEKNYANIRVFPKNISPNSLKEFTDVALTSHGSNGFEYPSFGIPCIIAENANYRNFGFTINSKSINEYNKKLKNIHKLKKLKNKQINKAKIFWFVQNKLLANRINFIPDYQPDTAYKIVNEENYWKEAIKMNKNFNIYNNQFKKMFFHQLSSKYQNTVNLDICFLSKNFSDL